MIQPEAELHGRQQSSRSFHVYREEITVYPLEGQGASRPSPDRLNSSEEADRGAESPVSTVAVSTRAALRLLAARCPPAGGEPCADPQRGQQQPRRRRLVRLRERRASGHRPSPPAQQPEETPSAALEPRPPVLVVSRFFGQDREPQAAQRLRQLLAQTSGKSRTGQAH